MRSKGSGTTASAPGTVSGVPTQPPPSRAAVVTGRVTRARWWSTSLLLLLTFVVLGVAPLALAVRLLAPAGLRLPAIGPLGGAATPTTTATVSGLPLPSAAWVASATSVRAAAGSSTMVALLQPGFPVQIQAHTSVGGATWDRILWAGPTPATGGQGWVPDAALSPIGGAGPAVGDSAALAPSLATTLQGLGANIALAVYYPTAQQLYLTNGDQAFTLGTGARSLVLTALMAHAFSTPAATPSATVATQATPVPATPTAQSDQTELVARGDQMATALAYQQIGGGSGLSDFTSAYSLAGITPAPGDWTQIQATPRALAQFYGALANLVPAPDYAHLDTTGRTRVLSLLTSASNATVATPTELAPLLAPPIAGAHVALVVGALQTPGQATGSWTVTVAGTVTLPNGTTYVIAACVRDAASRAASAQTLQSMLTAVAAVTQG